MERLRLSVALALIGRPRLLGVDDVDLKLSPDERAEVWELLRSLTEDGTTVVAVCAEAPEGAVVASTRDQDDEHDEDDEDDEDREDPEDPENQEDDEDDEDEEDGDALVETGRS